MLTTQDITRLAKVLATKEDIRDLNTRLTNVEVSLSSLTTTVDGLSNKVDNIASENLVIKRHLKLI